MDPNNSIVLNLYELKKILKNSIFLDCNFKIIEVGDDFSKNIDSNLKGKSFFDYFDSHEFSNKAEITKILNQNKELSLNLINGNLTLSGKIEHIKNNDLYIFTLINFSTNNNQSISREEEIRLINKLIYNHSDAIIITSQKEIIYSNKKANQILTLNKIKKLSIDILEDFINDKLFEIYEEIKDENEIKKELIVESDKNRSVYEISIKKSNINNICYLLFTIKNISLQYESRKQLENQEEKFRNIIDNMNLGLIEVDLDDKIIYSNSVFSELSGFEKDELLGKIAGDLFLTESSNKIIKEKRDSRLNNISDSYEIQVRTKNNEARWWLISGAPNINDKGEVIGSIGIHLDITNQKKLEKDLENALKLSKQSSEEKERFLTNMSHEIRTPLNGIIGMASELEKTDLNKNQSNILKIINKASEHLLSVINSILDLAKIEAGESSIELSHFNLKDTINEIEIFFQKIIKLNNVEFKLELDFHRETIIKTDRGKLKQIIINLLNNAIRHSSNKSVLLSAKIHKNTLDLIIKDTGEGMSEDFLTRLFTKFSQENNQNNRNQNGTGLGLLISKELIELLGGSIKLESQKNIGTNIFISLPIVIENEKDIKPKVKINLKIPEKTKILIAEDNEMNIEVLKNIFNRNKIIYEIALNGKEAISIAKQNSFDLILMDIQMPVIDGIEATKTIINEFKINTPIIGISANAFKSEIKKCLEIGMVGYITKPFKEEELLEIITKNIKKSNITIPKEPLFNIEHLMKISNNDMNFTKKMLQLFLKMIDENKKIISSDFNENNEEYKQFVHKLKPSVISLNANSLRNLLLKYESSELSDEVYIKNEIKDTIETLYKEIKSMLVLLY